MRFPLLTYGVSLAAAVCCTAPLFAQTTPTCGGPDRFRVLHFTETKGFDHRTRDESIVMFRDIGAAENFSVRDESVSEVFDQLDSLLSYELVIFSNTSGDVRNGDSLLTRSQQRNLETYVNGGGAFLGIHAATDTYRDRSWPFYNQLVGGIVQSGPNHTANNHTNTMDLVGTHPSTANVPDPWTKTEEYYYWERNGGMLDPGIVPVLRVRQTDRNGVSQSYDDPRPISWYQEFPSGARSFYTALGHAPGNYTDPANDFRQHLRDALCWAVEAEFNRSLPLGALRSELLPHPTRGNGLRWALTGGDVPRSVELHGGLSPAAAVRLAHAERPARTGVLYHRPAVTGRDFHYRLRLVDPDGLATWGPWHLAPAADADPAGALTVTYDGGRPGLVNATDAVLPVVVLDAGGRLVFGRQLPPGRTELTGLLRPGVYFVRQPFAPRTLRLLVP